MNAKTKSSRSESRISRGLLRDIESITKKGIEADLDKASLKVTPSQGAPSPRSLTMGEKVVSSPAKSRASTTRSPALSVKSKASSEFSHKSQKGSRGTAGSVAECLGEESIRSSIRSQQQTPRSIPKGSLTKGDIAAMKKSLGSMDSRNSHLANKEDDDLSVNTPRTLSKFSLVSSDQAHLEGIKSPANEREVVGDLPEDSDIKDTENAAEVNPTSLADKYKEGLDLTATAADEDVKSYASGQQHPHHGGGDDEMASQGSVETERSVIPPSSLRVDLGSERKTQMRRREEEEHARNKAQFDEVFVKIQAFVLEANYRIPPGMKRTGVNPFFKGYRVLGGDALLSLPTPPSFSRLQVEPRAGKVEVRASYKGPVHPALAKLPTTFVRAFSLPPGQNPRDLRVEEFKSKLTLKLRLTYEDSGSQTSDK